MTNCRKTRVIGTERQKKRKLRKNKNKILDIKTLTQMKNAFDSFISRLELAKGRINVLEDIH